MSETRKDIVNYIKVRDDHIPVGFTSRSDGSFCLCDCIDISWANKDNFSYKELRTHIEPWLSALFQSEHLSLLVGSGLTHAIHYIATGTKATGMDIGEISICKEQIAKAESTSAKKAGRKTPNVEDQIRVVNELLLGMDILKDTRALILRGELQEILHNLSQSVLNSEREIINADKDKRNKAFICLVNFLMSFASRTGTRDRLNIFTTNYDRLIEAGSEQAGIHLLDRFVGTLTPIFRSSRLDVDMHYNPPGIRCNGQAFL